MDHSHVCPRCKKEWTCGEMDSGIAILLCRECFQAHKTDTAAAEVVAEAEAQARDEERYEDEGGRWRRD